MPDLTDLIWIEDVVKQYNRSRVWLNEQTRAGLLSVARIPGDKRVYLLRSELERFLTPQISKGPGADGADAGADPDRGAGKRVG